MQTTAGSTRLVKAGEGDEGFLGSIGVRFLIDGSDASERLSLVEHPMSPRALAAPLHLHTREDEYSFVLEGRMGALLGDDVVEAGPGDLSSSRAISGTRSGTQATSPAGSSRSSHRPASRGSSRSSSRSAACYRRSRRQWRSSTIGTASPCSPSRFRSCSSVSASSSASTSPGAGRPRSPGRAKASDTPPGRRRRLRLGARAALRRCHAMVGHDGSLRGGHHDRHACRHGLDVRSSGRARQGLSHGTEPGRLPDAPPTSTRTRPPSSTASGATPTRSSPSGVPPRHGLRALGCRSATGSPCSCRTSRRCWRRTSPCRPPGAS